MEYAPTVTQQQQQSEFPQLDSGLIVLVYKQGDDPIDSINHMMSFLSVVVTSCFPTTNNQLRNSSNPRKQATINDGRVTVQPVQGRQISFATVYMVSLADKAILLDAENCPPMLEKDMYDSWRSRMELYMLNRQHGRMILESVEHGPLLWPFVTEDGVIRLKKYSELSSAGAIQADCDVKATNIILQ
nr:hypothetical protein [Tanacetum cinerariifolium]